MPYTDNEVYRIAVAENPEFLLDSIEFMESEIGVNNTDETETENETSDVDYTIYLEDIITNQQTIMLYQLDTINVLNVNQRKQEEVQGFTASVVIGLFVIILIGGACKYFKSIF